MNVHSQTDRDYNGHFFVFRKVIRALPKKFALIVKVKHAINSQSSTESLTHAGYPGVYDQAPFIKSSGALGREWQEISSKVDLFVYE